MALNVMKGVSERPNCLSRVQCVLLSSLSGKLSPEALAKETAACHSSTACNSLFPTTPAAARLAYAATNLSPCEPAASRRLSTLSTLPTPRYVVISSAKSFIRSCSFRRWNTVAPCTPTHSLSCHRSCCPTYPRRMSANLHEVVVGRYMYMNARWLQAVFCEFIGMKVLLGTTNGSRCFNATGELSTKRY